MLIKKNDFILDHIKDSPISKGLLIKKIYDDSIEDIAYIYWSNRDDDCYIRTIKKNFQDNIVIYEDFQDFIYLVDEAYRVISLTNNRNWSKRVKNENSNI